ncbi:mediator of RNA polymerase II transcription subunit 8-like isoform X2 [Orbicella faveolata]|uniref:mediator of RNA polymerase II transcription subunit 8-like isoform X2 n=1 Tax=Orbicella faveolata TaxID=48498 RepID=UPI0009E213D3|nr:mediator of RNA polymerase II transcription subunit 8-like isoform X2 [Orbicella faveolata]
MQDEKLLEVSLEAVASRVQELKESIQAFLAKLEHEQLSWPSVLDNYALLSGQVNTLTKLLKNEKTPFFRNLVLLPLLVQQETDPDIQKATDGRIQAFNHEVVPDYLRTKYDPEIEESEQKLETLAASIPPDQAQSLTVQGKTGKESKVQHQEVQLLLILTSTLWYLLSHLEKDLNLLKSQKDEVQKQTKRKLAGPATNLQTKLLAPLKPIPKPQQMSIHMPRLTDQTVGQDLDDIKK